ncbi:CTD small phosphatase-like protein 2 [Nymphaea thermarum]|nr:CTD small phosphatase-like protein 2 [Nymphaea thermarum]
MKSKTSISSSTRKQTGLLACSRLDKIAKDSRCQPNVHHQAILSEDRLITNSDPCVPTSYHGVGHSEVVGLADVFPDVPLLVTSSYLPEKAFSPPLELKDCMWQELLFSGPVIGCEYAALPDLVSDDSDDNSTISRHEKNCNSESFHVTNGSTVGPVGLSGEEDLYEPVSSSVVGYESMIPEMVPDATEQCMLLPFLEEIVEANKVKSIEEALVNSDDTCLFLAIQEAMSSQQTIDHSSYEDLDYMEYFVPELLIANFSDHSEVFPSYLPASLPMQIGKRNPNTLVLDLDETLIHSSREHCPDADFSFLVCVNMKEHIVYVRQRPHLHTFLERVAEMFEIIIFTASQSIYADQLLNILDPDKKIISQRVYREACVFSGGHYVKDLTVLERDLAKVVIIDNTPQVFQMQVNNGIPIQSWFDDPTDSALLCILPFLEILASADDVRPIIANRFSTQN